MKIDKKTIIIISLVLVISLVIGLSYAYYSFSVSQDEANAFNSDCFELTFSEGNAISISNGIPVSDEDVNDLEPFHFSIRNVCNNVMDYNINIETLTSGEDAIDLNAIASKVDLNTKQILGSLENNDFIYNSGAVSSKTVYTGIITPNETKEHDVRLWIDESATVEQSANKSFSSKVVVSGTLKHNYVPGEKVLVTFDSNGGTTPSFTQKEVEVNSTYGNLPTTSKDGYMFLGWSASELPGIYQEVEYIKFNGNEYIYTGIEPTNHKMEIKFDFEDYETERLFYTSNGYIYYQFTSYLDQYMWGTSGSFSQGGTWTTGEHTLIYNDENGSVILDGEVLDSVRTITSNKELMFSSTDYPYSGKIYYAKITDKSTGELVRDFVPCYRKSDNLLGLYDKVTGEFYPNLGNGTLTKGEDLNSNITSNSIVSNTNNHTLYAKWGKNVTVNFDANGGNVNQSSKQVVYKLTYGDLPTPTRDNYRFLYWSRRNEIGKMVPNEYQEVDYVRFSGYQRMNTAVIPTNHTTEIKFDFENYETERLFYTASGYFNYQFTAYQNKYMWGTNGQYFQGGTWTSGIHTLIYNGENNIIVIDDEVLDQNKTITSNNELMIGSTDYKFNGSVYYLKITDKSTGKLVRYMVPCYRKSDNVIGMYDKINGEFYTNQGSGSLIKGEDVNNDIISSTEVIIDYTHTLYAIWEEE